MTKYFTQDFTTLPSTRKVEEISTMLLRILGDSDALTDANIALVDQITELRSVVDCSKYPRATSLEERIRQFETAVEDATAHVETLRTIGINDPVELEYAYYDQLRKINY